MIPLWKGKNPIYFRVITIIAFDNLYRRAYFVMHTFLVLNNLLFFLSGLSIFFKSFSTSLYKRYFVLKFEHFHEYLT
jgi:hypothetical protein